MVVQAVRLGANDFLKEPYSDCVLTNAVVETCYSRSAQVEQAQNERNARRLVAKLSPREHRVLEALLRGGSNKSIAAEIGISARTVEVYRANVMDKLGVQALPEAVRLAVLAGFR
jgi:two-component system, LuxR family, response regulator FixJ